MSAVRKPLTDSQLKSLKNLGFTKKELESLATIKVKNFYLRDGDNPGGLIRVNEDGTISNNNNKEKPI